MMARQHAQSGIAAGLLAALIAKLTGTPLGLPDAAVLALLTAGAALYPDLDHPSATAAHSFGPLSVGAAHLLDRAGYATWRATATELDRPPRDGHRTLTHTVVWAAGSGSAVAGACALLGRWALLGTLFVMISLAIRGLAGRWAKRHGWMATTTMSVMITGAVYFGLPGETNPVLVGGCVALGSWVHCLGDSLTLYGCPWLWPLKINGQRWYLIGTPQALRFRTGTREWDGEEFAGALFVAASVLIVVTLIPGGWAAFGDTAGWIAETARRVIAS